ncbi:MAG: type II toxin-antitoxin system RelE/ParE family toxin [Clostridia bacterium]|nr:type II toxin-antitoxin system RelE/ParE family toxin [Clostridia bacterium]
MLKLTPHAIAQIQETIAYISKVLLVPETARLWADRLEKEIGTLDIMPARFPLLDREPWRALGYHKMPIQNFIVYYFIDEGSKTVWVTAVVYARRDQLNALKDITTHDLES